MNPAVTTLDYAPMLAGFGMLLDTGIIGWVFHLAQGPQRLSAGEQLGQADLPPQE